MVLIGRMPPVSRRKLSRMSNKVYREEIDKGNIRSIDERRCCHFDVECSAHGAWNPDVRSPRPTLFICKTFLRMGSRSRKESPQ